MKVTLAMSYPLHLVDAVGDPEEAVQVVAAGVAPEHRRNGIRVGRVSLQKIVSLCIPDRFPLVAPDFDRGFGGDQAAEGEFGLFPIVGGEGRGKPAVHLPRLWVGLFRPGSGCRQESTEKQSSDEKDANARLFHGNSP